MTADWVKLPAELLERLSNRIINEVKGVNRVCFDEGLEKYRRRWFLYYGTADSKIAVAVK